MAKLPSLIQTTDNFAIAAASAMTSVIVGTQLKFNKGQYPVGKGNGTLLPAGIELQARDVTAGWVKFADGQVAEQHIGYPMPAREDLGDLDEANWPLGLDGRPADPWKNMRYLYLIDPQTGADYTFVTSSWGGRDAVEKLARQVYIKRQTAPGAIAIVRLETGYKLSPRYGNVPCPVFRVTAWVGDEPPLRTVRGDDEIPY